MFNAKNPTFTQEQVGPFIADENIIPYLNVQAMNFLKSGDYLGQFYEDKTKRDTHYGIAYTYLSAIDVIRIATGESLALNVLP